MLWICVDCETYKIEVVNVCGENIGDESSNGCLRE